MAVSLPALFCEEFGKLIRAQQSANEHFQSLMACLRSHNLAYSIDKVAPKHFLTHPKNRGGLMLSPHNVHRNAARIHQAGADRSQLTNAVCIEIAPSGNMRDEQLSKNRALIDRSAGLLAPINGSERYLTLGCGHTVAFCKTAAAGGPTSQKVLQTGDGGLIDVRKVCANSEFSKMIKDGWAWEIVPHAVDAAYPEFAIIAQKALNTQNHIGTEVGELEACMTLVGSLGDHGFKQLPNWRELAVQEVQSLNIPSAQYCNTLLEFVLNYGGGDDAPMICFMDAVAKEFGCNVNLGSQFWHALTYMSFARKMKTYPLIRVALAVTNMTGDKVEDGVARLLGKTDANKITTNKYTEQVDKAEDILDQAVAITKPLGGIDKCLAPLGQLFVRVGLKLTDKEKYGREGTQHSYDAICKLFLDGVSAIVGQKVEYKDWGNESNVDETTPSTKPTIKQAASSASAGAATLDDHKNASFIAGKAGFKVGSFVQQKNVDTTDGPENIFVIVSIGAKVELHQVCSYSGDPAKASVGLDTLLTEWSVSKHEPPTQMHDGQMRPMSLQADRQRAVLFRALVDFDAKHAHKHSLTFWRKPDEVRTTSDIAKGQLVLVPIAPMSHISYKPITASTRRDLTGTRSIALGEYKLHAEQDAVPFFVLPLAKPQSIEHANRFETDSLVAAFWWVGTTTDETKANMALGTMLHNFVNIPVLKNTVDLAPSTKLVTYSAPKAKSVPIQHTDAAKRQRVK